MNGIEILLVEDNASDAELTVRALKKHNLANNLYIAKDGAEALDFLLCKGKYAKRDLTNLPKVVFLDLKLPKVSGLEVLKTIKEDKRISKIPVVVVTSSSEEPDVKEAYRLGANSYVLKPLDFEKFMTAISKLGYYWLVVNYPYK
ncbi:MAG: response regulator [Bacteroidia bacterium]|nr:response regulator [Bacteroidia bacterium]